MKEKVTKFDLEDAFKALDEIDIPRVRGFRPKQLDEDLRPKRVDKFEALFEDYYDVQNTEDMSEAKKLREDEIAQAKLSKIEKIVDLDAESPEDIQPSYVGKIVIQCPQCMTMFYKNENDIEKSEDDETIVNVGEVCQHCGNEDGYTLIGKIAAEELSKEDEAESETSEEETEVTEEENNEAEEKTEETSETKEEAKEETEESTADAADAAGLPSLEDLGLGQESEEEEKKEESFVATSGNTLNEDAQRDLQAFIDSLDEEIEPTVECKEDLATENKLEKYVDDLPESCKNCEEKEAIKEDVSDAEFEAMLKDPIYNESFEKENAEEECVETTFVDDGKGGSKEVCSNCGKEVCECKQIKEDLLEDEIEEDEEDLDDIEDFVEESFNMHATDYLTEVYENVKSFKTTSCSLKDNKLIVEGNINFKSGKVKPTVFEFVNTKNKLCGTNKDLCEAKDVFTLNYTIRNKSFITESLKYAYVINSTLVENLSRK